MLGKLISAYKLWHEYLPHFPKTARYTLGEKIDTLFVDAVEVISIATFLTKDEKSPFVRKAIVKLDTLKIFLKIAWEINALETKKYITLSEALYEPGRMLGGWHNQLIKQNSPDIKPKEK